jgi:hypothetical protein
METGITGITYLTKDVFDVFEKEDCSFVHCISADCRMGKGVARAFIDHYGGYQRNRLLNLKLKVGEVAVTVVELGDTNHLVLKKAYHLVTKQHYWQKPTLASLRMAITTLKQMKIGTTLVMPRIGCGLDKLKWEDVSKELEGLKCIVCTQ